MSKPSIEQTKMGSEGIAFCIARTLIERDPSLKAPMRANLRKMWELLDEREDVLGGEDARVVGHVDAEFLLGAQHREPEPAFGHDLGLRRPDRHHLGAGVPIGQDIGNRHNHTAYGGCTAR